MPRWMVIWRMALAWLQFAILDDAVRQLLCAHGAGQPLRESGQSGTRARDIQRNAAADEGGRYPAEHQIGVGDGGLNCRRSDSTSARCSAPALFWADLEMTFPA